MSDILTSPRPSRFGRAVGFRLAGIGSYAPARVVTNADLGRLGCDPEWIVARSGIHERRHVDAGEATSDLAIAAGRAALAQAGAGRAGDVDLLVLGTFTPDMCIPSTACIVQEALGLDAPAMDVTAACAGFAFALVTAAQFVAAGSSRLALVIGADTNSRIVDPEDVKTWPLFGDGAGAVLLEAVADPAGRERGLLAFALGSDGRGAGLLAAPMSGTRQPVSAEGLDRREQFVQMDGRAIFKWAIRLAEENVRSVVKHAGLTLDQIDLFVLHQANARIIEGARTALGLPPERVCVNLDRYGNTSSGSIPLALDEAWRAGRVGPDSTVVVCGFGGGLAWGSAVWRL
jgi:3-oxoacyl-[acyl-carrier-protein] synthase-3